MISITDEIARIIDIWGMEAITLVRSALSKFAPPPRLSVSDWADGFRQLSAEGSAEPGRWRTDRAPYQREIMNAIAEPGVHTVVLMCSAQVGKALDINTPLPTPTGWVLMGDVRVGDRLVDENGQITNVTFVTPVMYDRPCWRLTFSDNSEIIADSDHQWTVDYEPWGRYKNTVTITTAEIANTYKRGKRNVYAIPVAKPIELDETKLPIDPYVLGVWLGDGHRYSGQLSLNKDDSVEIVEEITENESPRLE